MRRHMSLIISALLMLQLMIPSYAASNKVSAPGDTAIQISTTATPEFEISFPADMEIPWEAKTVSLGTVKAEKLLIAPNKLVIVSVSSANNFKLVHEENEKSAITYDLLVDGARKNDFSFSPGDYGKAFALYLGITDQAWAKASAGKYTDRLTFTVTYA